MSFQRLSDAVRLDLECACCGDVASLKEVFCHGMPAVGQEEPVRQRLRDNAREEGWRLNPPLCPTCILES